MTSLMLYVPSFCVSTLQSTQFMSRLCVFVEKIKGVAVKIEIIISVIISAANYPIMQLRLR